MVNFSATVGEYELIALILDRAEKEGVIDRVSLEMDLDTCHSNGCPLDFAKLLAAPAFDFVHDIYGIIRHMDRTTGELRNCFLPRCSQPQREPFPYSFA